MNGTPDKIRLVTERYRELQGLRHVLAGCALIAFFGSYTLAGGPAGFTGFALALLGAVGTVAVGLRRLDAYYALKFGRIVQTKSSDSVAWLAVGISIAITLVNQSFETFVVGAVAVIAIAGLWVAIRDWPLRNHHLLAVVAAAAATWIRFRQPGLSREMAEALGLVAVGAVSIPIGLLDHRLLGSVMRPPDSAGAAEEAGLKSCATKEPE